MTPEEYIIACERTINRDLTPEQQLQAQYLGLAVEAGEVAGVIKAHLYQGKELDREALLLECGDVLWSLANIYRIRGWEFAGEHQKIDDADKWAALFGRTWIDKPRILIKFASLSDYKTDISEVFRAIGSILGVAGFSIEQAMEANVAKLRERYPEGFEVKD